MSVPQSKPQKLGMDQLWIQHQRRNAKSTKSWACTLCPERRIFNNSEKFWQHALKDHSERLPSDPSELRCFRTDLEAKSLEKSTQTLEPRRLGFEQLPRPSQSKITLSGPMDSLQDVKDTGFREDETMSDISHKSGEPEPSWIHGIKPSKKPIMFDSHRPPVEKKTLWRPENAHLERSDFDPVNITSVITERSRASPLNNKARISNGASPAIFGSSTQGGLQGPPREEYLDIILQPETRPISQEQLVAEVKRIYAGLVMVEAKCIEVDNKQATVSQADTGNPPKLSNEQWQALIALHRTLLHEHHDFFLASQHPSASRALRCLASKYAMPARMWRHGIHSFLELLRHRLPASLDHMLAFTYSHSGRGQKPLTRVCSQVLKLYDKTYGTLLQAIKSSWAWNPFTVFPKRKHHFSISTIISFMLFQGSVAAPLDRDVSVAQPNGFGTYWDNQYRHFTEEYSGPLLMNSAWVILLTTLYFIITYCDRGRWKETDLLLIATSILSGGSFFLGMSEWLSYWQLSFLWLFNASLNAHFIQQKLTEFPRSGQLTAFAVGSLGFVLAGILAHLMTVSDGRYKNPWILAAMLVSPITIFLTISWLTLLRNTGVARYLEDGGYNAPVSTSLKNVVLWVVTLVLLLCLSLKN